MFVNNEITERGLLHRLLVRAAQRGHDRGAHDVGPLHRRRHQGRRQPGRPAAQPRRPSRRRARRRAGPSAVAAALRNEDLVVSREALEAVREFMTNGDRLAALRPRSAGRPPRCRCAASAARPVRRPHSAPTATDGRLKLPNLLSPPPEAGGAPQRRPLLRCGHERAVGRRDAQGDRQLPGLGPADPGRRRALARAHQGRRARASTPSWGCSTPSSRERIAAAGDAIAAGEHDDQFPIDVFQTGLGDVVQHERQRGHRDARRRGRSPQRPRQPRPVVERRLPLCGAPRGAGRGDHRPAAGARRAAGVAGGQGRGVRATSSRRAARTSWTPCR